MKKGGTAAAKTDPMAWLEAAQGRGILPGLARMERLLAALGNPERRLRCLHVAGTNGKGSVCAFAESILRTSGFRTGLYTSPHLVRFSERIRVNGREVSGEEIDGGIERLRRVTSAWPEAELPTYFELVTALAFDLFDRAGVEVVVLETGLGGRLDATNTAPKIACAISPIGLDHTEWLGGTLAQIAWEKAGIFQPGIPGVTVPQESEAMAVLEGEARRLGVFLEVIPKALAPSVRLGLAGSHQRENAALALALLRAGGYSPTQEDVALGLASVEWPGRFQRLKLGERELVLDGAHNLHAALRLAETWREEFGDLRCRLIFGAMADKNPAAILAELAPLAGDIVLVPVASPRTADPKELSSMLPGYSKTVHTASSLQEALVDSVNPGKRKEEGPEAPVLLAGSLFLVGEALAIISGGSVTPRSQ